MAARGCAAGTGAVPWSRAAGVASARLDGVGLDAALSWKLTAVMEQTTTEVKFYHLLSFSISLPLFCLSGRLSLLPCYFLFSFHLNKKRKNQPHCSSPSSHCAVPVLLRLPKSPAGHYYTEYVFVCVYASSFCASVFVCFSSYHS